MLDSETDGGGNGRKAEFGQDDIAVNVMRQKNYFSALIL